MKQTRHNAIIDIITKNAVSTQEELTEALRRGGFKVTQATVSRDIKTLGLIKRSEGGVYRYVTGAPASDGEKESAKFKTILGETVISVRRAGNIVVIKTYTGMANAAAAAVDALLGELAVGTIAGDDTIFVATENDSNAETFTETVGSFLFTAKK